ncbi:MAG: hypothetical protein WEC84_00215 [Candidatus Andersenbacteria bacterium]
MIIAITFLCASIFFGIAISSYFRIYPEKVGIAALGTLGGLTFSITLTYLFQLIIPFSPLLLLVLATILTAVGGVLLYLKGGAYLKSTKFDKRTLIVFIVSLLLFLVIAPKLLIENEEGLSTGVVNAYGDVAWHASNITMFVAGQDAPPENPIFAGTRLTYPFLVNFFSAMLIIGGLSLAASITIPAVILIPILLTILYIFARDYTASANAATIAVLLFAFGGATLGWLRFGGDLTASGQTFFEFITHLPTRDYSGVGTDQQGFHFLNPITSLLLPQRAFLFGIPIALSVLILLRPRKEADTPHYLLAGVLAGMLPLFHGHTAIALTAALIGLFVLNPTTKWVVFGLTASIIGIPELLYYGGVESEPGALFRFEPRWMAGEENLVWYWLKNTGLLIPLALLGLWRRNTPAVLKALAASGLGLFILANTFAFAPWVWDNFKLFVFFFIFVLPLVTWVITAIWKQAPTWGKYAVVILLIAHVCSAGLDVWKLALPTATIWGEWSREDIHAAQQVTAYTKPLESIITAPTHNSAVVLAGRPRYLGYAAHVWSHGASPWNRETAIKDFYEGRLRSLPEHHPDYIFIGPQEQSMYTVVVQPQWDLVFTQNGYSLYRI